MNKLFNNLSPISLVVCILIFILLACDKEDEEREIMDMASQPAGLVQIDTGINVIGLGLSGQLNAYVAQENTSAKSAKTTSQSTNARVNQTKPSSREVKWSSSDESIATVDENGLVKGLAPGEVTITATSVQNEQLLSQKSIRVTDGQSDIKSFIINGVLGKIDGTNIIVSLPAHTDVTALQPEIKHTGMAIRPGNKEPQDFTKPVTYAVYGRDRSFTKWNAMVTTESDEANADGAFVTTWVGKEIFIPINTTEDLTYNYNVDWNNDGIIDQTGITGDVAHTFAEDGEHTIRITGTFPAIRFGARVGENFGPYWENAAKIISIDQWGKNEWLSFSSAFKKCVNLELKATDAPDLSKVTNLSGMFTESGIGDYDFSEWNTSNITNMGGVFAYTHNATQLNVSNWNTSNVTRMASMFNGAASNPDVSNWNTTKVTQMGVMFKGATNANPDLSQWDFSSVGGNRPTSDIVDIFHASGISQENYEKFLIRLAEHDHDENLTLAQDIRLRDVPVSICNEEAQAARALLISKGWIINDQGVDPACQVAPVVVPEFRQNLSELNIYEDALKNLVPSSQVFEYDLNTPLFTDYAHKQRLIALPDGTSMSSNGDGLPDFPNNTVITKTFYYYNDERNPSAGKKIIETRVLIKKNGEWVLGNYVWNDAQTDAILTESGSTVDINYINSDGDNIDIGYEIPSAADCFTCHQSNQDVVPIGPKLRNMNGTYHGQNQLQALIDRGWLSDISHPGQVNALPKWDNPNETDEFRARAYLEVNCAHCHTNGGFASFYNFSFETPYEDTSIPLFTDYITTVISSGYMPKIGTTLVHEEGLDVVRDYIESLE